jgi:carbamoyltransferase
MIILGINGWIERSHDASACLIKNGKILSMAEEERFIRQKYAFDKVPINAISYCLKESRISPNDIDIVALGWDYRLMYKLHSRKFNYTDEEILDIIFPLKYFNYKKRPKLIIVPHHLAHAASAFFTSGFKKATILVVDGQGERESTTIAYGEGNKISILKSFPIKDSLGYFYESINKYIGFNYLDSGKTMGLAPYGEKNINFRNIELNKDGYTINFKKKFRYNTFCLDEQKMVIDFWNEELRGYIKFPNKINYFFDNINNKMKTIINIPQQYKNLAASAQTTLEKIMIHLVDVAINMTGIKNLCLSGGVALNCAVNGKLLQNKSVNNLFIFPSANDAGVSIGAALYAASLYNKKSKFSKILHPYFGPKYTNKEIEKILKLKKINYIKIKNICETTAKLLSKNKIIGWFQGKMEIGPRALGNRSIIANPTIKSNWEKLNIIKGRELWRPLACSILEEYKDEYFETDVKLPFMLITSQVKNNKRNVIPAVVHIDGSSRVQTVSKKTNKKFWNLINEFYKITGIPIVLNTSFNYDGEPIVSSPLDAIKTFFSTSLDYLVIGDFLISK